MNLHRTVLIFRMFNHKGIWDFMVVDHGSNGIVAHRALQPVQMLHLLPLGKDVVRLVSQIRFNLLSLMRTCLNIFGIVINLRNIGVAKYLSFGGTTKT